MGVADDQVLGSEGADGCRVGYATGEVLQCVLTLLVGWRWELMWAVGA